MLRTLVQKSNKRILFQQQQIRSITHQLPPLDFDIKTAIPGVISPTQLDFHYNKHHKTYVDNLNNLIKGTPFENEPLEVIIKKTAFEPSNVKLFNNAAQHFNHAFYWKCLTPNGPVEMPLELKSAIERQWNSVDAFKKEFTEKAVTLFGSGWVWLVTDGASLKIWSGGNAQTPLSESLVPLLTVDVWEHAYYLDYQNRRAEYMDKFWGAVNWKFSNAVLTEGLNKVRVH